MTPIQKEKARRAKLHRQIGALRDKLYKTDWAGKPFGMVRMGRLKGKIARLETQLAQPELFTNG